MGLNEERGCGKMIACRRFSLTPLSFVYYSLVFVAPSKTYPYSSAGLSVFLRCFALSALYEYDDVFLLYYVDCVLRVGLGLGRRSRRVHPASSICVWVRVCVSVHRLNLSKNEQFLLYLFVYSIFLSKQMMPQ